MNRVDVLRAIKAAGARGDYQSFMRLYVENRISFDAAKSAYNAGFAIHQGNMRGILEGMC